MKKFLESSTYIDWETPGVQSLAKLLSTGLTSDEDISKSCFEWVRDNIKHSSDYELNPVTCKASDVLAHKTGFCYAKSHLLAALLRANDIPTGLCYQRLSVEGAGEPYCLHGLNAVFLKIHGWYRVDPRGNKEGISAQFSPPQEQLAYGTKLKPEKDLPEIWSEPLQMVTSVLEKCKTYGEVCENLPDIVLWKP